MNSRIIAFFVLISLALSSFALAQSKVKWEPTLDEAMARAKKEGKPLLISMHTSTEVACQRMLKNLYTDPQIVPILNDFVILPTCFDTHEEVLKTVDGKKISVSPLFGTLNCKQLAKNEEDVRSTFFDRLDVKVPQHLFVGDDGKVYMSKIYELKKPAFIVLLNNALILYGSKAADGMDKVTRGFLKTAKKGSMKSKRKAVRGLLGFQDPRRLDILYLTIQSIKKETEKGECVRAFGRNNYEWAAPTVMKWLRDPSEHVRNCAVVSLEEMKAQEAMDKLMALFKKAKDKEMKKDLLRALGPCSDGSENVKDLLIKNVRDRREVNRIACYLSLGYYLDSEDVQKLLQDRFKKEGKSIAAKTAIIWAYTYLGSDDLIPQLEGLVKKEKNHQLKYMVNAAKLKIRTGDGVDPKDGRSGYIKIHNAFGAIFSKDKLPRNAYKYWKGDD